MHITLDTNPLYVTRAGIARYINGLLAGFEQLDEPHLRLSRLAWPVDSFSYTQPARGLRTLYRERIWPYTSAARWLRDHSPDLLHITSGLPFARPATTRAVATLYDLAVLRHPERFRRWHRHAAQGRFQRLHAMDRIICISQFTADEAMRCLELPADKLEVVYPASSFVAMPSPDTVPPLPPDLPSEFFLFVGSLEPGKNLSLLKQTYQLASENGSPLAPLVIVGARWQGVPTEGRPREDWIYAGRLPDAALTHLYRKAIALVFPSQYEGFGLPVLEAMSQGCPVICSRVASLPEVAGEAACYAEATPTAYRTAMDILSSVEEQRQAMIERGIVRAQQFSWKQCASETQSVYEKV
jgi:glycosyltransferase involved in cell wall biosynthesis